MKFYSTFEAADTIGVTPQTLRRWRKKGIFVPDQVTFGGHYRYSEKLVKLAKKGIFSTKPEKLLE